MKEKNKSKQLKKLSEKQKTGAKGITLIALVITIIVLLILAAVSIATLTGENGILTKANDAGETTKDATEEEQVKIAVDGALTDGTGTLSTENVKKALKKEFGTDKVTDTTFTGEGPWTFKGERKSYTIEKNGNIISGDTTTSQTGEKLAKDVLKVNTEASEDAQDYEKSPYVKYNNILCRVFYNDTEHGLQIISADNITKKDSDGNNIEEKITLGKDDSNVQVTDFDYEGTATVNDNFKKAAASYNKAVDTLNERAKTYKDNSGIVTDARSLGSIAKLKDGKFQLEDTASMYPSEDEKAEAPSYITDTGLNDKLKTTDTNYEEDADKTTGQLQKLGLNATSETWLASRKVDATAHMGSTYFEVRYVTSSGKVYPLTLCNIGTSGGRVHAGESYGFRPVFLLSSDVKIKSGDGTESRPYELEI